MKTWVQSALGEIAEITIGGTPDRGNSRFWNGINPWVAISDLNNLENGYIYATQELITDDGVQHSNVKLIPKDTIIFSFKLSLGKIAITGVPLYTNEAIASLILKHPDNFDTKFLYYALHQINWSNYGQKAVKGNCLNKAILEEVVLSYPASLDEQRRIARILDQADRLRRLRRHARQQTDTFLQSVFIEMFGDPATNPKGWEKITLESIKPKFIYGTSTKCGYSPVGLPVLRIPNILSGQINCNDLKYAELPDNETTKLTLKTGDLLFVRTNGNLDYVGRCAVFDLERPALFASYLIRARLDQTIINPHFLAEYLKTPTGRESMFPHIRTTAGQYNISIEGLNNVEVLLPPLEEQNKFIAVAKKLSHVTCQQQEAERQAEMSFQALLHRAFSGQLAPEAVGV